MGVVEVNGYTIEPFADLAGADLAGANLVRANLTGAGLCGANLTGANLTRVNFTRAVADKDARWPEGFDPEAVGVTFE